MAVLENLTLLGPPKQLPGIIRLLDIERVILAFSRESHEHSLELIRSLKDLNVQIDVVLRLYEMVTPGIGVHTVEGLPLIGLPSFNLSPSSQALKRAMDVLLSGVGLILLAPFFAVIALGAPASLRLRLPLRVDDLREHIRLTQNQNILDSELDLGHAVLREADLVPSREHAPGLSGARARTDRRRDRRSPPVTDMFGGRRRAPRRASRS
jgi:hypothetical protein